jgi:hypothetical protein
MTTGTTLATPAGMMIQRLGRRNLSALRHPSEDLMTVATVRLGIMLRMTEANSERRHILWRARIPAQLMTRSAR